jgi:hypothetical protein
MKMSTTVGMGICLVLGGIVLFCFAIRWLAPHPDVAFELPISLSPGHVITGNFSVKPGTLYYIDIELDKRWQVPPHCEPRSVLSTQWVLSSDGEEEHGSSWRGITSAENADCPCPAWLRVPRLSNQARVSKALFAREQDS